MRGQFHAKFSERRKTEPFVVAEVGLCHKFARWGPMTKNSLDNSIFVSTFSPEPILGIIGQFIRAVLLPQNDLSVSCTVQKRVPCQLLPRWPGKDEEQTKFET